MTGLGTEKGNSSVIETEQELENENENERGIERHEEAETEWRERGSEIVKLGSHVVTGTESERGKESVTDPKAESVTDLEREEEKERIVTGAGRPHTDMAAEESPGTRKPVRQKCVYATTTYSSLSSHPTCLYFLVCLCMCLQSFVCLFVNENFSVVSRMRKIFFTQIQTPFSSVFIQI